MHVVARKEEQKSKYTSSQFLRQLKKDAILKYQALLIQIINIVHSSNFKK